LEQKKAANCAPIPPTALKNLSGLLITKKKSKVINYLLVNHRFFAGMLQAFLQKADGFWY
jgi:hypothetical protein